MASGFTLRDGCQVHLRSERFPQVRQGAGEAVFRCRLPHPTRDSRTASRAGGVSDASRHKGSMLATLDIYSHKWCLKAYLQLLRYLC